MPNLADNRRMTKAADWTAGHRLPGPFAIGLAAIGALLAPFPLAMGLRALADLVDDSILTAVLFIPTLAIVLLPYPIFFGGWLPGYVVGRSNLGRTGWWLLAAGFLAPLAIPLVVLMFSMLRSYGGSALTLPLLVPLLLIPLRLGYRRGRRVPPHSAEGLSVGR